MELRRVHLVRKKRRPVIIRNAAFVVCNRDSICFYYTLYSHSSSSILTTVMLEFDEFSRTRSNTIQEVSPSTLAYKYAV